MVPDRSKKWNVVSGWCAVALVGLLVGCDDEVQIQVIEEVTFDESLDIDLAAMQLLPSGVYIEDLIVGTGASLDAGVAGTVDHNGYLIDGTEFSSGVFPYTSGGVVPGFEAGIIGMLVGGERRVIIPPDQGYGARGSGPVPPGAIMIFTVLLISIP